MVRIKVNVTRLAFETLGDFPANAVNISVVAVNTAAAYLVWRIRLFVRYAPLCTEIKKFALKISDVLLRKSALRVNYAVVFSLDRKSVV